MKLEHKGTKMMLERKEWQVVQERKEWELALERKDGQAMRRLKLHRPSWARMYLELFGKRLRMAAIRQKDLAKRRFRTMITCLIGRLPMAKKEMSAATGDCRSWRIGCYGVSERGGTLRMPYLL